MASKKDKMAALDKIKDKEDEYEDEDSDKGKASDDVPQPPELDIEAGDGDDIEPPESAGGDEGGMAEEGADTPGAGAAEGMLPEGDEMGTVGGVIAEKLAVSPEAGRALYEAAISIPKYADMDEMSVADMLDRDINTRMEVEMRAAKNAMGAIAPDEGGMGAGMGGMGPEMGPDTEMPGGSPL